MQETHTHRVDLNLAPALAALLDERHVSRAAERIGVSQPAMSRTLQRLRRQFGDPLLIRGPDGYALTRRAERIQVRLARAVADLEHLFEGDEVFDASTATQSLHVAMSDYTFSMLGPALARTVVEESPNSVLSCVSPDARVFDKLDAGSIDLLIYGRPAPVKYSCEELFTDQFVCVVAVDHPCAHQQALTLAQYVRWPHVAIDVARSDVDRALHAHGQSRRTVVNMPYHSLAADVLPGTELILTVAGRVASRLQDFSRTRILRAPKELGVLQFASVWHPRLDHDVSQAWLRRIIRDAVATHRTAVSSDHALDPTAATP